MLSRAYVCGRTCLEAHGAFFDETSFPGRQGRLAWTYLVLERHRTITREQLIDAIWGDGYPPACDRALSAILSKLRALLRTACIDGSEICSLGHSVRLLLPTNIWIDVERAYADLERANRYRKEKRVGEAYGWALASYMIVREELLPGEESAWIAGKRNELFGLLMQSIDALIQIYSTTGNTNMALQFAQEAVARDPLHESAYRELMRLFAEVANNAAVASTYRRCCEALASQVNGRPSQATDAAYRRALERSST